MPPCDDRTLAEPTPYVLHLFRPLSHSSFKLPDSFVGDLRPKPPGQPLFSHRTAQTLRRRAQIRAPAGHPPRRVNNYLS